MNTAKAGKEMWASFDEDHNRTLAEILNELPGVQCEIRTPFVDLLRHRGGASTGAQGNGDGPKIGWKLTVLPNRSRGFWISDQPDFP